MNDTQRETAKQAYLVRKLYLPCCISHRKYSLTLDNFSLSSQQLVSNYFLYPAVAKVLTSISVRFWSNFHQINTPRRLVTILRSLRPV